jgi:phosphocarrier protein HPr
VAPTSSETIVELPASVDLHARPAANFVRTAMGFQSRIDVSVDGKQADAKSLLAVLALGARGGTRLCLRADGDDAGPALEALSVCVATLQ